MSHAPGLAQAPEARQEDAGDLPRRDRATLWGAGRLAVTPVTRDLMTRIVRGFYPGWNVWPPGCLWVAAPEGADPLTDPAVIHADSATELIQMIAETAAGAR